MKENIITTNFDPNKYSISVQSMKIDNNENKAIHRIQIGGGDIYFFSCSNASFNDDLGI